MTFPLFEPNGDIVRANWQVAYRHPQFYIYSYDVLDRLTSGRYGEIVSEERQTANGFPFITRYDSYTDIYSVPNIQYDGAGNITSLQRMGRLNDNCGAGQIDALTYTYTEAPRLANVVDSAPDPGRPKGFRPGSVGRVDYSYDYNGNLTADPNKNLTIQYNFLNLPKLVNSAPVVYDAAGRKWRWGNGATARETFNGIDFVGGQLEGFLHDKGRVAPERNAFGGIARLRAEYWRQDHLGNTRVAFSDQNGDGFIATRDNPATPENEVEIMQENHYYPFGMNHDGRWFGPEDPENRRTYNGKEYTDELGLDWYDYGARWYDAALGRWNAVDPMGEMMLDKSGYSYALNNPVLLIDAVGMLPGGAEAWEAQSSSDIRYDWFSRSYKDRNGRERSPNLNRNNNSIDAYFYNDSGGRLTNSELLQAAVDASLIFAKNGFKNLLNIKLLDNQSNAGISLKWSDLYLKIRYDGNVFEGGMVNMTSGIPDITTNYVNLNFYGLDGKSRSDYIYGVGYLMAHEMLHSILRQTCNHFTGDYKAYNLYPDLKAMGLDQEIYKHPGHENGYPNLNMDGGILMNKHGGIPNRSSQLQSAETIIFDHKFWISVLLRTK